MKRPCPKELSAKQACMGGIPLLAAGGPSYAMKTACGRRVWALPAAVDTPRWLTRACCAQHQAGDDALGNPGQRRGTGLTPPSVSVQPVARRGLAWIPAGYCGTGCSGIRENLDPRTARVHRYVHVIAHICRHIPDRDRWAGHLESQSSLRNPVGCAGDTASRAAGPGPSHPRPCGSVVGIPLRGAPCIGRPPSRPAPNLW